MKDRRRSPRSPGRPRAPRLHTRSPSQVMLIEEGTLSIREKIDVVLRDVASFDAAAVFRPKPRGSVGAPRRYPEYTWTLWPELRSIFGSHTAVERELGRGGWWEYIRRELRRLRPDLPPLPVNPPSRQHYAYMRKKHLMSDDAIDRALNLHIMLSTAQAKEAGNFDPDGEGSTTHPVVERSEYGDGKVVSSLYGHQGRRKSRKSGEVKSVRIDEDAGFHAEGGGGTVWGIKFAILSTRREEGRFILGIEHVTKHWDEAKAALDLIRRTTPYTPGAQAVVWDMILRGEHINIILTEFGLVPVVGVHAQENPEGGEGRRKRTFRPKTLDLDDVPVTMADGTQDMAHISACNGAVCLKTINEVGEPVYDQLRCVRLQRHQDLNGFRWYGYYTLPDEYGGQEFRVTLHQTKEDRKRGINRTENLRPIPEGTDDFDRLHVLRPDAESINRGIEDTLYIKRASAKGWRAQFIDLLGHARLVNAITLARYRARDLQNSAA